METVKIKKKITSERKNLIGQLLHLTQLRKNSALENASRESIPIKTQREIGLKNNRIKHTRSVIQY